MKGYVMFIWFKPDPCDLMYRQVLFDVLSKRLQTKAIEKQCHQVVFCVLIEFCSFRQSTIENKNRYIKSIFHTQGNIRLSVLKSDKQYYLLHEFSTVANDLMTTMS